MNNSQIVFIGVQCNTNNIVTTSELVFRLLKWQIVRNIIKVDFAKAFDMVNWEFLLVLLVACGFGSTKTS